MIAATAFSGKKVAVFGLGASGVATARALLAGDADVVAWDDNPDRVEEARRADIAAADLRMLDWSQVTALILAPGVPLTHPRPHWSVDLAQPAGVEIIGDVEIFVRERRKQAPGCSFIAITGTNGKSTTTALIAHILRQAGRDTQLGGNIGTPVLTLAPLQNGRFYVVECSSYQVDLAPTLNPTAGILLNLSPDHLDRHGSMEHYADVKERLVAGSDLAIVGVDDHWCVRIADRLEQAGKRVVRISNRDVLADGYYAAGSTIRHASGGTSRAVAELSGIATLRGAHNAQNAAAAIAACTKVGLSEAEVIDGLRSFAGLKHRMQPVARRGRVLFVNDSKATNADAAAPALSSYKRIYWIVGGLPKEGGIDALSDYFMHLAKAYLIGEAAPAFAATLGDSVDYEIAGTLERAVERAADDAARDGDEEPVVLLSPACASFDQFKNFEIRGDAFVHQIAQLPGVTMLIETGDV
ncbi:MAG: UDP-N-acetylmuramoyl-L-alanine--D-glutamate ligase [Pseudomonadota bacterium]